MNQGAVNVHEAAVREPSRQSAGGQLLDLALSRLALLHEDETAYADATVEGHRETHPVWSAWMRRWLLRA